MYQLRRAAFHIKNIILKVINKLTFKMPSYIKTIIKAIGLFILFPIATTTLTISVITLLFTHMVSLNTMQQMPLIECKVI